MVTGHGVDSSAECSRLAVQLGNLELEAGSNMQLPRQNDATCQHSNRMRTMRLSMPARLPSSPVRLPNRPKGLLLSGKEPKTLSDSVARMLAAPANILRRRQQCLLFPNVRQSDVATARQQQVGCKVLGLGGSVPTANHRPHRPCILLTECRWEQRSYALSGALQLLLAVLVLQQGLEVRGEAAAAAAAVAAALLVPSLDAAAAVSQAAAAAVHRHLRLKFET